MKLAPFVAVLLLLAVACTWASLHHIHYVHAARTFGPARPYAVDFMEER